MTKTKLNVDFTNIGSNEIPISRVIVDPETGKNKIEPIVYVANIVGAKEEISKSGNLMLVLTFNILDENYNSLIAVNDYFPYKNKLKLLRVVNLCRIDPKNIYIEDFLNRYIKVTLRTDTYETSEIDPSTGEKIKMNTYKIDKYVGAVDDKTILDITSRVPF